MRIKKTICGAALTFTCCHYMICDSHKASCCLNHKVLNTVDEWKPVAWITPPYTHTGNTYRQCCVKTKCLAKESEEVTKENGSQTRNDEIKLVEHTQLMTNSSHVQFHFCIFAINTKSGAGTHRHSFCSLADADESALPDLVIGWKD